MLQPVQCILLALSQGTGGGVIVGKRPQCRSQSTPTFHDLAADLVQQVGLGLAMAVRRRA